MKTLRYFLAALALCLLPVSAQAVTGTCYWVGGSGNWDNSNTASWASTSGGTTGTCVSTGGAAPNYPHTATDVAVFDSGSAGTVTVCGVSSANCPSSSGLVSLGQITAQTFTGTVDFSVNNPNVTTTGNTTFGGAGNPTLSMGNGVWTGDNLNFSTFTTFNKNNATIVITAASGAANISPGSHTFNGITLTPPANQTVGFGTAGTFSSISITAPAIIQIQQGNTITDTDAGGINIVGTSSNLITIQGSNGSVASTLALPNGAGTAIWTLFREMTVTGNTLTATNSFGYGTNTGITITPPSAGGGGYIIGQ